MKYLDYEALRATPVKTDPYNYIVVPIFVRPEMFGSVFEDFPTIRSPGSIPPSELEITGHFAELLKEMNGPEFRSAIEKKFGIDLSGRPTMFTIRGRCRSTDGKIHTDSESKIITVLLYLNRNWEEQGGCLRILRSGDSLEDVVDEVSPNNGTLLVFQRSENSWHGHEPFEGERRVIQMNWVTNESVVEREQRRHRMSAMLKKLNPFRAA